MTALAEYVRQQLKQGRAQAGLSASQLAHRVGSQRDTIYAIENGHRKPSMDFLGRLCDALGLTVHIGPAGGEDR